MNSKNVNNMTHICISSYCENLFHFYDK